MKTIEIEELWKSDAVINDIFLDKESLRAHELHHKYYTILNSEKKALSHKEGELKSLKLDKYELFAGILSEEKLKERGWEPYGLKILKTNISMYIDADEDILKSEYQLGIQKQKIEFLSSIITQIHSRSFIIKNAIEYKRFTAGLN